MSISFQRTLYQQEHLINLVNPLHTDYGTATIIFTQIFCFAMANLSFINKALFTFSSYCLVNYSMQQIEHPIVDNEKAQKILAPFKKYHIEQVLFSINEYYNQKYNRFCVCMEMVKHHQHNVTDIDTKVWFKFFEFFKENSYKALTDLSMLKDNLKWEEDRNRIIAQIKNMTIVNEVCFFQDSFFCEDEFTYIHLLTTLMQFNRVLFLHLIDTEGGGDYSLRAMTKSFIPKALEEGKAIQYHQFPKKSERTKDYSSHLFEMEDLNEGAVLLMPAKNLSFNGIKLFHATYARACNYMLIASLIQAIFWANLLIPKLI